MRQRVCARLFYYMRTVDLDRSLTQIQVGCDNFVCLPPRHKGHDLVLARRQRGDAHSDSLAIAEQVTPGAILFEGFGDAIE